MRLAIAYSIAYVPYVVLVKMLADGSLVGTDGPVNGLIVLPAASLGQLVLAPIVLGIAGYLRSLRRRPNEESRPIAFAVMAGLAASAIVAATTLNYTFAGISVLLMLLLMRGGSLIVSPIVDKLTGRTIARSSWVAVGLAVLAVIAGLADVSSYDLTALAVMSLLVYLVGYTGRFVIMGRFAKTGDATSDGAYFAREHLSTAVWQPLLLGLVALCGQAETRAGFSSALVSPIGAAAFAVGATYEMLFVFGSLIYLGRREFTWCIPANRCASLAAGLFASVILAQFAGQPVPGPGQLVGLSLMVGAVGALCWPRHDRSVRAPSITGADGHRTGLLEFGRQSRT